MAPGGAVGLQIYMILPLINILEEAIYTPNGELATNGFAHRLHNKMEMSGDIPDEKLLLSQVYRQDKPESQSKTEKKNQNDVRLTNLLFRNVRQYCIGNDDTKYYSIKFSEAETPVSYIMQGANGSGKTTIFAILEHLYLGKSKIAESHGHSLDSLDFFRSINHTEEDIEIKARFKSDVKADGNHLDGYEISSAFCSENDYFEITRSWKELTDYLAQEMGYGELYSIIIKLRQLHELLSLSYQFRNLTNSIAEEKRKIREEENPELKKAYEKKKKEWTVQQQQTRKNFLKKRGFDYRKGIKEITMMNKTQVLPETTNKEIEQTLEYLEFKWQEILEMFSSIANPIFSTMLSAHLLLEHETMTLQHKGNEIKIALKVKSWDDSSDDDERHPVDYFNTFRLKLFCIAFKMSLFCCAKIKHKINIPFVVDDIFDSSDFNNRSRIGSFIRSMIQAHDSTMKLYNEDSPLQLIFLTQDNIIGENVYRGMRNAIDDFRKEQNMKVKYGRLFNPQYSITSAEKESDGESSPIDLGELDMDGENIKVINIIDPLD